jgi:hypothetical protein
MQSEVEAGDRQVSINNWSPEHRRLEVSRGNATELRVRTFYYPLWVASSSGQVLFTRPDSDGALLISLPGNFTDATPVNLDFREPRRTHVAAALSAFSWLLIGVMAVAPLARPKQSQI